MTTTPTPEAVERFDMSGVTDGERAWFVADPHPHGKWVLASDYASLLARVDALTKELAFSEGERSEAEDRANAFATKEMRTEARAIRAEAQRDAALAASGAVAWLPIETAPKDGRQILAFYPQRGDDKMQCAMWIWETDDNDDPSVGVWWHGDGRNDIPPTHWMPLQAPPDQQEKEDGL